MKLREIATSLPRSRALGAQPPRRMDVVTRDAAPCPSRDLLRDTRPDLVRHLTMERGDGCNRTPLRQASVAPGQSLVARPNCTSSTEPDAVKTSRGILRGCGSSAPNVEPNSRYRITIQCAPSAQHAASCSTWGVGSTRSIGSPFSPVSPLRMRPSGEPRSPPRSARERFYRQTKRRQHSPWTWIGSRSPTRSSWL